MNLNSIKILNPWWEDPKAIDSDEHIIQVRNKPYYFNNPVREKLTLERGRGYILRGCRQIGKTTILKEKIKEAIEVKEINAKRCLFLSCESFGNYEKLQDTIVDWLYPKKAEHT